MPVRIPFSRLIERIQDESIDEEEVSTYFTSEVTTDAVPKPSAVINTDLVDVGGLGQTAALSALSLLQEAARVVIDRDIREGRRVLPDGSVVAEGDSWFNLPNIVWPRTIVDFLARDFPITNIATPGHRLIEEVLGSGQYVKYLVPGQLRFLLLSGGGNDLFPLLETFVSQRRSGDNDPANAPTYLRPLFYKRVDEVKTAYKFLIKATTDKVPDATIILHGYDYPLPRPDGPYLGARLQFRGFHPRHNKAIATALVRHMVDVFNTMMGDLAAQFEPTVQYIDLRKKVRKYGGIWDEIHPNANAAKGIATNLFAPRLGSLLVG